MFVFSLRNMFRFSGKIMNKRFYGVKGKEGYWRFFLGRKLELTFRGEIFIDGFRFREDFMKIFGRFFNFSYLGSQEELNLIEMMKQKLKLMYRGRLCVKVCFFWWKFLEIIGSFEIFFLFIYLVCQLINFWCVDI